jgi:hypothetical protein
VWATETSASEPPRRCRKRRDDVKTGGESLTREESGGDLIYCPGGVRHEGGVTVVQAGVRNVGTCRPDAKGEAQVEAPQAREYQGGAQGRSRP